MTFISTFRHLHRLYLGKVEHEGGWSGLIINEFLVKSVIEEVFWRGLYGLTWFGDRTSIELEPWIILRLLLIYV